MATSLSDVDIAVYFYPEKRHPLEYEEEVFHEGEDEIWADLERLLKKEVEVLVLKMYPRYFSPVAFTLVLNVEPITLGFQFCI